MTDTRGGTRELIAATALDLFQEHGYSATSLRMIADRLGLTKAALYYHYPAKEHLVIELTKPFLDGLAALLDLTSPDAEVATPADQLLEGYLDLFLTHHRIVRFLSQDVGAQQHPDVGIRARTLVAALQRALAGTDASEADLVRAGCALGVVHSVVLTPGQVANVRTLVLEIACSALRHSSGGAAG